MDLSFFIHILKHSLSSNIYVYIIHGYIFSGKIYSQLHYSLPNTAGCNTYAQHYKPSLEEACAELDKNQVLVTMFNENYKPKNCRSALEGVWQFAYQNRFL